MYEFKLPDVGEGIHEAEVVRWLVQEGDIVTRDQPIVEVQTDKAVVEIPSPVAGKITQIRVPAGTMAHVGDVLVAIEESATAPPAPRQPRATNSPPVSAARAVGIAGPGKRVRAAPAVRKLARELGVDLAQVPGSGPAGRVLPSDVRAYAAQQQAQPAPQLPPHPAPRPPVQAATPADQPAGETVEEEPLHGLRRRIAERMTQAWQIPQVTTFDEVDAAGLVAVRQTLKPEAESRGVRLTYLPLIIKAVVQTLKEFPYFNASLDMTAQKILLYRHYHIGVAVAAPDGLLVPVIRHADRLTLLEITGALARLSELAGQRKLSPQELTGSTFTITNFGSFGAQQGTPIINPPEAAILGVGRIEDRPVAREGQVVVRPMLPLALSFDHRLIDGEAAGRFMTALKKRLAAPSLLLLEAI